VRAGVVLIVVAPVHAALSQSFSSLELAIHDLAICPSAHASNFFNLDIPLIIFVQQNKQIRKSRQYKL